MIKFLYIVFLGVTSFLLFIFSKEKEEIGFKNQTSGTVTLVTDSTGQHFLGIITDQGVTLHPSTLTEDVVLTAGQKVLIGYNVDSLKYSSESGALPVHIKSVNYLTP
ncbi:MAG: hypothetical protein M9933_02955 [Chitinophagaceae bacterium]|nr:hypothetical protein [Chitinophagaceae bacterium]